MTADLVALFRSLADMTRLRLLNLLAYKGELCVCDLEKALETGQPQISRHLAYLKHAGWVWPRRERTWMLYSLRGDLGESTAAILHALQREWVNTPLFQADQERLDRLIQHGSCHSTTAPGKSPVAKEVTRD